MKKLDQRYIDYINSKEWAEIRNKALIRDNFKCSLCGNTHNLQVHHLNYNNFMNETNHLEDLMTLCNKCHEKIEKQKEEQQILCNDFYEKRKKYQGFLEKEKEFDENYKIFIKENENLDIANLEDGKYDFCDMKFLKSYITQNYGQNFYDNLRKNQIQKYFGNKRNIAIAKLIKDGKKIKEILKYRFTYKRVDSVFQLVKKMQQYSDIYELLEKEYNKQYYGGKLNKEMIECLIRYDFIKDNSLPQNVLLKNIDNIIMYADLYLELGDTITRPILIEE